MVDILGDLRQELRDLMRRIRVLESASPLGYSSISEGALEIRSEEGLIVQGSARVDGVLKGSGTFDWTGPWDFSGPGDVTGDVSWSGDLTLTGDMTVVGGGKIAAGNVVIDPSAAGGQIRFGSGRTIDAGAGFLAIRDGSRFVVFNASGVSINAGGPTFSVSSDGITISGLPTRASSLADGAAPGSIWLSSTNQAYKVVAG